MLDWTSIRGVARRWFRAWRGRIFWSLIVGLLAWRVGAYADDHDLFREEGPIDRWQTLIAGVIAIGAAFVGGYFVNAQIKLAKDQEAERQRRRQAATRATMPLTLSAVMEYARGCGQALRRLYLATPGEAARAEQMEAFELPPVPGNKIAALVEIIEAGEPEVGRAIASLLRNLQVQDGRLRSTKADILDPHGHTQSVIKLVLEDYIIDAADVYARCEGMLGYAREEADTVGGDPSAADLRRALTLMGFHGGAFDRVKATIDRRHGVIVVPIEGAD